MLRTMFLRAALVLGTLPVTACGLLDVSDPTTLQEEDLNNGTSANLLRREAAAAFSYAIGRSAIMSAMMTDEMFIDIDPSFNASTIPENALDRRESLQLELTSSYWLSYGDLQQARHDAIVALPRIRTYAPVATRAAYTAQLLAIRGYLTLRLAEDYCPGFALNDIVDGKLVFSPALTTTAMLDEALDVFDSALVYAADTARFLHMAEVGRARTLLALGRFAEAGAAAQAVPVDFAALTENLVGSAENPFSPSYTSGGSGYWYSTSNREGGGLDFDDAVDPRVVNPVTRTGFDGVTQIRAVGKYPTPATPIAFASGIEARLIEAEAALNANGDWLGVLNALRTNGTQTAGVWNAGTGGVAGLAPFTDPGTPAARVDLLFRERGFWLFATGKRLADLRRLVAHYDRTAESVFPSGTYHGGGVYGTGTSMPFPAAIEATENPAVAGGCTSR